MVILECRRSTYIWPQEWLNRDDPFDFIGRTWVSSHKAQCRCCCVSRTEYSAEPSHLGGHWCNRHYRLHKLLGNCLNWVWLLVGWPATTTLDCVFEVKFQTFIICTILKIFSEYNPPSLYQTSFKTVTWRRATIMGCASECVRCLCCHCLINAKTN